MIARSHFTDMVRSAAVPLTGLLLTTIVVGGLVAVLLLGGSRVASTSAEAPGVDAGALPPIGSMWFGSDFDERTFAVIDRDVAARTGSTVAAVARLSTPVTAGRVRIVVERDGAGLADHDVTLGPGNPDLVGWTFALPVAGWYRVLVVGPDGAVLAAGEIEAR